MHNQAVVVERSRVSYLINILGMLKVEGSNPGHSKTFIFVLSISVQERFYAVRNPPRRVTQPRFLVRREVMVIDDLYPSCKERSFVIIKAM